jgi:hypothetical protein
VHRGTGEELIRVPKVLFKVLASIQESDYPGNQARSGRMGMVIVYWRAVRLEKQSELGEI